MRFTHHFVLYSHFPQSSMIPVSRDLLNQSLLSNRKGQLTPAVSFERGCCRVVGQSVFTQSMFEQLVFFFLLPLKCTIIVCFLPFRVPCQLVDHLTQL